MSTCRENEQTVGKALVATATLAGFQLEEWGLRLQLDDLADLPAEGVLTVLREAYRERKFPTTKEICDRVLGRVDDKDEAQDCADRIIEAIPRFGSYRSTEALAHLGELASEVVKRFGGWAELCNVQSKDLPTMRAQLRDSARSILAKAKAGTLGVATALPKPSMPTQGLNSAAGLIEGILPPRSKP